MCQINVHPDLFNTFLTTAVAVMYMHLYLCSWKLMYYQNKLPGLHTALFVCCSSLSGLALVFRCSNSPKASRSDVPTVQKPHVQMFQQSQSLTFRCSNSPKASRSTAPAPLHITAPPSDQQPLCSVFSAAVNPPLQFIFSILITSKRRQGTDLNRLM